MRAREGCPHFLSASPPLYRSSCLSEVMWRNLSSAWGEFLYISTFLCLSVRLDGGQWSLSPRLRRSFAHARSRRMKVLAGNFKIS